MPIFPARVRALSLLLALGALPGLRALDVGPVALHGAVSLTSSYSDRYAYLGDTAKRADLNIAETILNGNHRFSNGLRLSAQLYAYQLGDYRALALDFASLDYSFSQQIGLRLGRVKHGFGFYGESEDLDMIRPFAFLPFDFYSKTERVFGASIDGAELYGNIPLGQGSIDYQVFGGWLPKIDTASPLIVNSSDGAPFQSTGSDRLPIYGTWIAWNTPLEGLRVGSSVFFLPSTKFSGPARSSRSLAVATTDARLLPYLLPPGLWDFLVAGKTTYLESDVTLLYFSTEYTRGNWQFTAEAKYLDSYNTTVLPLLGSIRSTSKSDTYYAMATWQAAPKIQLGAYYSVGYANRRDRSGRTLVSVPAHTGWSKEFAFATSYNLAPWWLVKAEVHLVDGTKGLGSAGNGDPAAWRARWTYFALKTTLTF